MYDSYNLDEEKLIEIVLNFIEESKVERKLIKTGAVIITGESSLKDNSSKLVETIADITGEFIITTAGAQLESILAGYGSGAEKYSRELGKEIINVDIGGGTTNCVKFDNGKVEDTVTFHIGGRLITIDEEFRVLYLSPILMRIPFINSKVEVGKIINKKNISLITDYMAEALFDGLQEPLDKSREVLYVTKGVFFNKKKLYMISGGVGEYVYRLKNKENIDLVEKMKEYGDIGVALAESIVKICEKRQIELVEPKEKLRATVCGAGAYTMKLSGNTIYMQNTKLPIKNLPFVRVSYDGNVSCFIDEVKRQAEYYSCDVAIYITYLGDGGYIDIRNLALAIVENLNDILSKIIIIMDKNLGKALGEQISYRVSKDKIVISLDGIENSEGNYIDIGNRMGDALPVVIKSLVF